MDRLPQVIEHKPVENSEETIENTSLETSENDAERRTIDEKVSVVIEDKEEPIEDKLPEPQVKERIDTKEIFKNNNYKNSKEPEPVIQVIKKPKRPISDKQRENLAKARVKALASRQHNARLRAEGKLPTNKALKDKIVEEHKKPIVHNHITNNITHDDIKNITKKAIEDYEITRKEQKKVKKERRKEAEEKAKIKKTIENATKVPDPFGFCY